jgi:hypothetical protein
MGYSSVSSAPTRNAIPNQLELAGTLTLKNLLPSARRPKLACIPVRNWTARRKRLS